MNFKFTIVGNHFKLPSESAFEVHDEQVTSGGADATASDTDSVTTTNAPLIHIWIPSAFLRTDKNGSHHVYQIYVRIRNEEWNIYRRFSQFFNLNDSLKSKYPIVTTIAFPKKKAIGNKDNKFVENRRIALQSYLREIVNVISNMNRELNLKPCRESLVKAMPFFA